MKRTLRLSLLMLSLMVVFFSYSFGQWSGNPLTNTPVSLAADYQDLPQRVMADGMLGGSTPVAENTMPDGFRLEQNYPNPFNPLTTIRYQLPHCSFVSLTVYNTFGQQISQLVNEQQTPGNHEVVFHREQLPPGTYFYRLEAGGHLATRILTLLP